jgi:pSer/pThr/pTyr-binding forkhead associated (FHA) protein
MSEYFFLVLRIIMAASLYAFLGWALYSIWHYLKVSSSVGFPRQIPLLTLIPLDSDTAPQIFSNPEAIIGRDPHCEYSLPDDTISAHHARFSFHHKQWWLEDLKSTNGTLLNGEKVEVPTIVVNDDEVSFGTIAFQIKLE